MISKNKNLLRIALAQCNSYLGDVNKNIETIENVVNQVINKKIDIVVFPEMFLSGYPPDDLILRIDFMRKIKEGISKIIKLTKGKNIGIVFGAPFQDNENFFNSLFFVADGKLIGRRDKINLPNYGVFDDKRHFTVGNFQGPIVFKNYKIGFLVCEDLWTEDICETLLETGSEIIISINASPYEIDKIDKRMSTVVSRILETKLPIIYLNMIGGQDEIVFDGGSFVLDQNCKLISQQPQTNEDISIIDIQKKEKEILLSGKRYSLFSKNMTLWEVLMLSIRDYCNKNNFRGVLIGLSGGIDSALVATLAVDSLGSENVRLVMMPSKYTSNISIEDAKILSNNLNVKLENISIEEGVTTFGSMLEKSFKNMKEDITEENIQSRIRGMLLMALSNKSGYLVLATGNKSEYAVGYSTLYGDMCGGFAPIKDVWKTKVFELASWRNQNIPRGVKNKSKLDVIPERTIKRPPSAELRPDQEDTDSLPPYEILDPILKMLTEEMLDISQIEQKGYNINHVSKASQLLFKSEFKRFQSPPGPKITEKAFGRDRRLPITSKFNPN